jgi:dTDP-4-amino-4,6-dideoxygalactose transaminase
LNYRLPEFGAALGLTQLAKLDEGNKKRKKLVEKYISLLGDLPLTIPFIKQRENENPSYHIFPVLLPENADRNAFIDHMKRKKIQTSIHYPSFKQFSYYKDVLSDHTPVSDEISKRVVTLPLYPAMSLSDIEYIVKSIKFFFSR